MARRGPGWRDEAAAALVVKRLGALDVGGSALVMEDPRTDVSDALAARLGPGAVTAWRRRAFGGRSATPWPPPDGVPGSTGFDSAFLRLPKAKEELEMAAHAAAHRLAPAGRLFVYGAKDEGAGSAGGRVGSAFADVRSLATGGRCRLLEASGPRPAESLRAPLEAWRIESPAPHPALPDRAWISYPGVFAAGRLDEGTALLLETLADLPPGVFPEPPPGRTLRLLDFGCGSGVVGAVARELLRDSSGAETLPDVTLLDVDAVALHAARENVPGGRTLLSDGWKGVGSDDLFDTIVANPPYHRGKAETTAEIERLVAGAPERLVPGGTIHLVAQRRLPVGHLLERHFGEAGPLAEGGAFRVWSGTA